jgi:hypothetical protein
VSGSQSHGFVINSLGSLSLLQSELLYPDDKEIHSHFGGQDTFEVCPEAAQWSRIVVLSTDISLLLAIQVHHGIEIRSQQNHLNSFSIAAQQPQTEQPKTAPIDHHTVSVGQESVCLSASGSHLSAVKVLARPGFS